MIHFLFFLALEWALIALAMWLAHLSPWFWLPALAVIGTRQHAISILGHDGAHFTIARNQKVNDWLSCLALWPLGMGLNGYRRFHWGHHMHVGTPRDTELEHKRRFWAKWSPRNVLPLRRLWLLVTDLCGAGAAEVITMLIVARPITRADRVGPPLTIAALAGMLIALGQWQAVLLWFVALYTVFWATFRQRALEEHCGRDATTKRHRRPALWRRLSYLPHYVWRHFEHHAKPGIPARELR